MHGNRLVPGCLHGDVDVNTVTRPPSLRDVAVVVEPKVFHVGATPARLDCPGDHVFVDRRAIMPGKD